MTVEHKIRDLYSIIFLKQKRYGSIKGRRFVDGMHHHICMQKELKILPNVLVEYLMISCMIYKKEDRYMSTSDITLVFLQTYDTSVSIHLNIEGFMANLLDCIDLHLYQKYTTTDEKYQNVMYAECIKATYVTLYAEILLWVKVRTNLKIWGFKM